MVLGRVLSRHISPGGISIDNNIFVESDRLRRTLAEAAHHLLAKLRRYVCESVSPGCQRCRTNDMIRGELLFDFPCVAAFQPRTRRSIVVRCFSTSLLLKLCASCFLLKFGPASRLTSIFSQSDLLREIFLREFGQSLLETRSLLWSPAKINSCGSTTGKQPCTRGDDSLLRDLPVFSVDLNDRFPGVAHLPAEAAHCRNARGRTYRGRARTAGPLPAARGPAVDIACLGIIGRGPEENPPPLGPRITGGRKTGPDPRNAAPISDAGTASDAAMHRTAASKRSESLEGITASLQKSGGGGYEILCLRRRAALAHGDGISVIHRVLMELVKGALLHRKVEAGRFAGSAVYVCETRPDDYGDPLLLEKRIGALMAYAGEAIDYVTHQLAVDMLPLKTVDCPPSWRWPGPGSET